MRKVAVLGSTGSIGQQALDVIDRSDCLEAVALSAGRDWQKLVEQARRHSVDSIALSERSAAVQAAEAWTLGRVHEGADGLVELITDEKVDLVLNALVGAAGLGATVATLGEGKMLALANKESLVVGGELVMELAAATGADLIPVDSEHSALYQLTAAQPPGAVVRVTLTASGGPLRGLDADQLGSVTPQQALAHPTWDMGDKITIDSATLMNKGLEVVEAHHLFGISYSDIEVVVHPQSIVHALVELNDGSSLAHLGQPDMRVPISYALNYPDRCDVDVAPVNLAEYGDLSFEEPDEAVFPCLKLARDAGVQGGTAPCVLNAANEIAVSAFLGGQIGFTDIPVVIEATLDRCGNQSVVDFEDLYRADDEARIETRALVERISSSTRGSIAT